MNSSPIVWPVIAQVFVTLSLYFRLLVAKKQAVKDKTVDSAQAATNPMAWPSPVRLINNNLDNQFSSPTLFYVGVGLLWGLGAVDTIALVVAWVYVAARLVHMLIHTTTNVVKWRMRFFTLSLVALITLFILAIIAAAGGGSA